MDRGSLVLPQTNLKKSDLSAVENSSMTDQNHWTSGEVGSVPLYVATDLKETKMSKFDHGQLMPYDAFCFSSKKQTLDIKLDKH